MNISAVDECPLSVCGVYRSVGVFERFGIILLMKGREVYLQNSMSCRVESQFVSFQRERHDLQLSLL